MSLDTLGASNFYYYGKPSEEITNPTFSPGQKITTQLPASMAKVRIGAIFLATAYLALCTAKHTGQAIWCWPVAILGTTFAAYEAYKHLLAKDPLVETFYKIAGGKENYDQLPEIEVDTNTETWINSAWSTLEHPVYRFTTPDGRKGMLVKGLSISAERPSISFASARPSQTKATLLFVEKFSPYKGSKSDLNSAILMVMSGRPPSTYESSSSHSDEVHSYNIRFGIYPSISTDMANEFIAQRGTVHEIEPRVVELDTEESGSG